MTADIDFSRAVESGLVNKRLVPTISELEDTGRCRRGAWSVSSGTRTHLSDALSKALADHAAAADDRGPLIQNLRGLVHSVTVHPKRAHEGFEIEVKGKLAALIGGAPFPEARYSEKPSRVGGRRSAAATYDSGFEVVEGRALGTNLLHFDRVRIIPSCRRDPALLALVAPGPLPALSAAGVGVGLWGLIKPHVRGTVFRVAGSG